MAGVQRVRGYARARVRFLPGGKDAARAIFGLQTSHAERVEWVDDEVEQEQEEDEE